MRKIKNRRIIAALVIVSFILTALIAGYIVYARSQYDPCKALPAKEINIAGHEGLYSHLHAHLKIIILGNDIPIPPDVGRQGAVLRPVHTHDSTGILHVESRCPRNFTLGDFFQIWDMRFDDDCIFQHCNDKSHKVRMFVDGKESSEFGRLVLKDDQDISIVYE